MEVPEPGAEVVDEQFDRADWDGLDLAGVTFRRCHFLEASMVSYASSVACSRSAP